MPIAGRTGARGVGQDLHDRSGAIPSPGEPRSRTRSSPLRTRGAAAPSVSATSSSRDGRGAPPGESGVPPRRGRRGRARIPGVVSPATPSSAARTGQPRCPARAIATVDLHAALSISGGARRRRPRRHRRPRGRADRLTRGARGRRRSRGHHHDRLRPIRLERLNHQGTGCVHRAAARHASLEEAVRRPEPRGRPGRGAPLLGSHS